MYRPGNSQYDHHDRTFGGASAFGYKDFIPRFTAEKFDAERVGGAVQIGRGEIRGTGR